MNCPHNTKKPGKAGIVHRIEQIHEALSVPGIDGAFSNNWRIYYSSDRSRFTAPMVEG
jgi:hypothetical protein